MIRIGGMAADGGAEYAARVSDFFAHGAFQEVLEVKIERLATILRGKELEDRAKELERKAAQFSALRQSSWSPQKPSPYGDGISKGKGKKGGGRKCFTWIRQGPGRGLNCGNPMCTFDHSLPSTKAEALDIKNFARSLSDWNLDVDYPGEIPRAISGSAASSSNTTTNTSNTTTTVSEAGSSS
ncbi:unnamed protein product [Amoebophrya sp. A25]|nr:unnamed protein product [Amoebophrya sp. A25]|eukprot:GSA25T00016331001.1